MGVTRTYAAVFAVSAEPLALINERDRMEGNVPPFVKRFTDPLLPESGIYANKVQEQELHSVLARSQAPLPATASVSMPRLEQDFHHPTAMSLAAFSNDLSLDPILCAFFALGFDFGYTFTVATSGTPLRPSFYGCSATFTATLSATLRPA